MMKALRFEDNELKLVDSAVPRRDGEALVRMTVAGICNTDIEIARGYADFSGTLGHEFVGVVEESPDRSQIGRRVVISRQIANRPPRREIGRAHV